MRYGIIVNPVSGKLSIDKKRKKLKKISGILGDCIIGGLDTDSKEQFCDCARDLAKKVDVLIIAGGDGTASDVINAVDSAAVLSYLPFGSGCALSYALNLPARMTEIAKKIKNGKEHSLDLILCDNSRKAFMASIGLEAAILQERKDLQKRGLKGPPAYAVAAVHQIMIDYDRVDTVIEVDGDTFTVPDALTTIITKIPYYGYRMKIVPGADFGDGYLHLLAINANQTDVMRSLAGSLMDKQHIRRVLMDKGALMESFMNMKLIKNLFIDWGIIGQYRRGAGITVITEEERHLQTDGELHRKGSVFNFKILPGALRMVY